ncbi:MAG: hypothetical protein JXR05_14820 [Flavobacteriaceae bacterium]
MKNTSILFFLLLVSMTLVQCTKTDWSENYKEKEKSPFGTYIIYNETESLFDDSKKELLDQNIYDYLVDRYLEDLDGFNYICIKRFDRKTTQSGINELLAYVYEGNNAFFSLNYFSDELQEALEIKVKNLDSLVVHPAHLKKLKGTLQLKNTDFKSQEYSFDRNLRQNYFESYNNKASIVLGTQKVGSKEVPNFLKIYHGKGAIYVHTQPIVFTNYNMLNENHQYAEDVLSYLPSFSTLWDPQIRSSQLSDRQPENSESILVFFWKNPSLKWFLYIGFFGLILFMIFNARRKQRPIPIISTSKNSTVEFTQTISNLYLKNKDHKNLADKKILYFLEKIRTQHLINTSNLNSEFIKKLALKSGNELSKTKYLINTILAMNKKATCSEEELMVLHKMIDNFLKRK